MKILIEANPVVRTVLTEELCKELRVQLSSADYRIESVSPETALEKGFAENISISVLTKLAAKVIGEIIVAFTKKHKVKIIIQEADGRKIEVSCSGDECEKLENFLIACVK